MDEELQEFYLLRTQYKIVAALSKTATLLYSFLLVQSIHLYTRRKYAICCMILQAPILHLVAARLICEDLFDKLFLIN